MKRADSDAQMNSQARPAEPSKNERGARMKEYVALALRVYERLVREVGDASSPPLTTSRPSVRMGDERSNETNQTKRG